ncbi:MAG: LPS export ABC transporter permease LptF [Coxiella sp. RIFCSPHIGHO2_12_FULL_42_15]|nr:MAG: LPS export ABC transporter permease LptF [Coxiella sp. RIFCSPHIGHO2_12_FULL_42_15]
MIIFRYLAKEILSAVFATAMVLMMVFVANQFIHYLNDAASGKLTVHAVVMVTVVQVPMLMGYILPMSLFLAILLTLGRLCVDHEMMVLSSCGVSKAQIVQMVMIIALAVCILDGWLMLVVEPLMFRYRTEIVTHSVESATLKKVLPGRFQTLGSDNQVLYVSKATKSKNEFHDVFVAMKGNSQDAKTEAYQWDLLSSDSVVEKQVPNNGEFFIFNHGYRYSGIPGDQDYQVMQFGEYWVRLPVPKISMEGRYSAMSTRALMATYSHDNRSVAELQWRVVNVLATLVFALLAVPLSEVNPRKGKFAQMLPAILIYVAYANMMFVGKSWIQENKISPEIGLWWVLMIILLLAGFLFSCQSSQWHRLRYRKKAVR